MKKKLIILLLGISCTAFAQNATTTGTISANDSIPPVEVPVTETVTVTEVAPVKESALVAEVSAAKEVTIIGTVSDKDGNPLVGVFIAEKGTQNGTSTDIDGGYSINVAPNALLVYTSIGYATQEMKIRTATVINVTMLDDLTMLEQVVVIGYGTTKKALLTGANINVTGEKITSLSTSSAMEALQGITPGVSITRNSGAPGSGTRVSIRGLGTIGNSEPLYIVDGVSVTDIDYLSPHDIASLDILKDAASAAIYGSRAANGVVLVTTVKGEVGKVNVSYSGTYGFQNMYKKLPALNAQEYMYIMDEGRVNDGLAPMNWKSVLSNNSWLNELPGGDLGTQLGEDIWKQLEGGWEGTDWVDEISTANAPTQNHSISITGAKEDFKYSFGFSYMDQASFLGNEQIDAGYQRITARINTEVVLFKNQSHDIIKIGENLTYTNSQSKTIAEGDIYWNDLHDAIVQTPLMPAYWDDSPSPYDFTPALEGLDPDQDNPLAVMHYRGKNSWGKGNTIVGNVYAEIQPIKNLVLRSSFGINAWFGHNRSYDETYQLSSIYSNALDGVTQSMNQGASYTWTNTLSYKFDVGDHHFEALVGHEMVKSVLNTSLEAMKQNTQFRLPQNAYLDNAFPEEFNEITAKGKDWAAQGGGLLSYMARLSYNYKDKYIIDATLRADGSSNFADGNRWGYFPSVSAGWILTEEDFLKDNNILSFGKIRASWGQNGNQSIDNFIYLSNIAAVSPGYFFGDNKTVSSLGAAADNVSNPDVTWETSEQLNIGLDTRFFDSRLGFTFDWYRKMTKDWLVVAPILGTFGATAPFINGGDIKNTGVEILLGWNDEVNDFRYGINVSGAYNKNEVTRIANAEGIITGPADLLASGTSYVSRVEVGMPIGYFYGYKTDGVIQNQAEVDAYVNKDGVAYFKDTRPGDLRFVDKNDDGIIDDKDKQMLGKPNPDFELGIQLNFDFKGIFLNATLTGKFGMQVMQSYRSSTGSPQQNYTTAIFDRWHGEGTSDRLPRLTYGSNRNNSYVSDVYMHDADFLRLSNITIGYDFRNILKKVSWIKGAKLYATINNLYTFTGYDGMDPDVAYGGGSGFSWASGIDLGLFPVPRTILFGINLTF